MSSFCPHCRTNLSYTSEGREYSKVIGVEVQGVYDGTLFWMCPKCNGKWHRWPEGHPYRTKAAIYVKSD
jgi:uncharacterized protein with PIN domain